MEEVKNIQLDKETCEQLRKRAAERGITLAELLHEILEQSYGK